MSSAQAAESNLTFDFSKTISRTIRTVAEVNALTEPQARAWLKFLDEPVPTLSGTPAAKLATLRQAVLDGFRGE